MWQNHFKQSEIILNLRFSIILKEIIEICTDLYTKTHLVTKSRKAYKKTLTLLDDD